MELHFHLQTLTMQKLMLFGNGYVMAPLTLMGIKLIIHAAKVFLVESKIPLRDTLSIFT